MRLDSQVGITCTMSLSSSEKRSRPSQLLGNTDLIRPISQKHTHTYRMGIMLGLMLVSFSTYVKLCAFHCFCHAMHEICSEIARRKLMSEIVLFLGLAWPWLPGQG